MAKKTKEVVECDICGKEMQKGYEIKGDIGLFRGGQVSQHPMLNQANHFHHECLVRKAIPAAIKEVYQQKQQQAQQQVQQQQQHHHQQQQQQTQQQQVQQQQVPGDQEKMKEHIEQQGESKASNIYEDSPGVTTDDIEGVPSSPDEVKGQKGGQDE